MKIRSNQIVARAMRAWPCLLVALALCGCASAFSAMESPGEAESRSQAARLIEVGERKVALAVTEQGSGPPVLLLHGLGTSSYTWRHVMPELARTHRVIAVDLQGFGASAKPLDATYTIRRQAELIAELIALMKLSNLTVIGHSYGGGVALMVALELAQAGPQRLRRLVLIDTIAYPQDTPLFFKLIQLPIVGDISMLVIPAHVQIEQALSLAYENPNAITREAVREYSRPLYSLEGRNAVLQSVRHIVPEDIEIIARKYPDIAVPTLIIWCNRDRVVPIEMGQQLAQNMPRATLRVVRECGHAPQEEQPEQTLKLIQAHLDGTFDAYLGPALLR
jgi:pimeloyl-ACP methyl ester carboxylesterase